MTDPVQHNGGDAFHAPLCSSLQLSSTKVEHLRARQAYPSGFITSIRSKLIKSSARSCALPSITASTMIQLGAKNQAAIPDKDNADVLPQSSENSQPPPPPPPGTVSESTIIGVIAGVLIIALMIGTCCWVGCISCSTPFTQSRMHTRGRRKNRTSRPQQQQQQQHQTLQLVTPGQAPGAGAGTGGN